MSRCSYTWEEWDRERGEFTEIKKPLTMRMQRTKNRGNFQHDCLLLQMSGGDIKKKRILRILSRKEIT